MQLSFIRHVKTFEDATLEDCDACCFFSDSRVEKVIRRIDGETMFWSAVLIKPVLSP